MAAALCDLSWLDPLPRPASLGIFWLVVAEPWDLETERELVARAKGSDNKALGIVLMRFGPLLYRSVLLPRLGNPSVAEQALGDTYARVVERLAQFEWQQGGIYPWLRTVALHVALDILRKRRREVLFQPEDLEREVEDAERALEGADPVAEVMEQRDLEAARRKLDWALGRIHPRYATAIRRRIMDECSRDEVARELDVTTATFDVILHRAMNALRKALTPGDESTSE